jgi:hypothetical protein
LIAEISIPSVAAKRQPSERGGATRKGTVGHDHTSVGGSGNGIQRVATTTP